MSAVAAATYAIAAVFIASEAGPPAARPNGSRSMNSLLVMPRGRAGGGTARLAEGTFVSAHPCRLNGRDRHSGRLCPVSAGGWLRRLRALRFEPARGCRGARIFVACCYPDLFARRPGWLVGVSDCKRCELVRCGVPRRDRKRRERSAPSAMPVTGRPRLEPRGCDGQTPPSGAIVHLLICAENSPPPSRVRDHTSFGLAMDLLAVSS